MTVIKLDSGEIILHSPIQYSKQVEDQINKIGTVKHLISPNKVHWSFIKKWKSIYPNAFTWGSPNYDKLPLKVDYQFDFKLSEKNISLWKDELDYTFFKGSFFLDEVVFYHKKSKTIVFTDLIENIEMEKVNGLSYKIIMLVRKNYYPAGSTPLDLRLTFVKRNEAFNSFEKILKWNANKIILAHGKNYTKDVEFELNRAFKWLTNK